MIRHNIGHPSAQAHTRPVNLHFSSLSGRPDIFLVSGT